MSISSENNRNDYTGDGATSSYDYTFRIFAEGDLLVTVRNTSDVETTLTLTTDYTVSGVGETSGGSIALVDSSQAWLDGDGDLLTGYQLTIRRVVDIVQETDIRNQGDFYPEVHEDAFDYLTMIDQQQQDSIDRSVKNPESVATSEFDPTLPADIATASVAIVTNSSGNGLEVGPSTSAISSAQSNATAAAASAAAASTSETNAAASEAAAAAAVESCFYRDVVYIDNTDSPVTIAQADNGKLYVADTSGGAITVNLPGISAITLPYNIAFKLQTAGNDLTISRNGTDTIDGSTTKVLSQANTGFQLTGDTDGSPDDWTSLEFGTVGDGTVTRAKLATGAVAPLNDTSKTANYTVTTDDDVLFGDSSGGAFTFTMPTEASASNRVFTFKKTSSDFNAITIDDDAASEITTINTNGETVKIFTDGTSWFVMDRYIPSEWTSYTLSITGISSDPTKATTTLVDAAYWRRVGDSMEYRYFYAHSDNTGAAAGSGLYVFEIPSGLTIDTTKFSEGTYLNANVGTACASDGAQEVNGSAQLISGENGIVMSIGNSATTTDWVSSTFVPLTGADRAYTFEATVPITGWNS